ncbi:MAG: hypothetical protein IIX64_02285 [Bacteroidales bacterium]|nr:hypothetical protein [Bacteroidales bacterium]
MLSVHKMGLFCGYKASKCGAAAQRDRCRDGKTIRGEEKATRSEEKAIRGNGKTTREEMCLVVAITYLGQMAKKALPLPDIDA